MRNFFSVLITPLLFHNLKTNFFQAVLPCLEELVFVGNPLEEKLSTLSTWRKEVAEKLPKLKKLDGEEDIRDSLCGMCQ